MWPDTQLGEICVDEVVQENPVRMEERVYSSDLSYPKEAKKCLLYRIFGKSIEIVYLRTRLFLHTNRK